MEIEQTDGTRISAIREQKGTLVPDLREPGTAAPNWLKNPFIEETKEHESKKINKTSELNTTIRAFEALLHRGKGGVYRAIDLSLSPGRLCILKEGRMYGEMDWDGRDGYWRVQNEANVISTLRKSGVEEIPKIYSTFKAESNFYVALEFIEGQSLQSILNKNIPIKDALIYGIQLARLLDKIHSAGWVWRDCKPLNLIVSNQGILRPIDFEGAFLIEQPDNMPWVTPGYTPPEMSHNFTVQSRLFEDLYALGATLHHLFSGQVPSTSNLPPIGKLRRNIPPSVRKIISTLLNSDPHVRPNARTVIETLESAFINNFGKN
ncbi:serine/threonine protein kinase [Peribacillus sp. NPDC101481]|uniref:serine/threonine protein kinase n=1 Tax=Peribacillus sp. NPDC101481 TaxID=3364403 RepID=UPI003807DC49